MLYQIGIHEPISLTDLGHKCNITISGISQMMDSWQEQKGKMAKELQLDGLKQRKLLMMIEQNNSDYPAKEEWFLKHSLDQWNKNSLGIMISSNNVHF